MTKEEVLELEGIVLDTLPGAKFLVEVLLPGLQEEKKPIQILCSIAGKLRKNNIRVMLGDRVRIEVSPYDLKRGRITYRLK